MIKAIEVMIKVIPSLFVGGVVGVGVGVVAFGVVRELIGLYRGDAEIVAVWIAVIIGLVAATLAYKIINFKLGDKLSIFLGDKLKNWYCRINNKQRIIVWVLSILLSATPPGWILLVWWWLPLLIHFEYIRE